MDYKSSCVRKITNVVDINNSYQFDNSAFDSDKTLNELPDFSPKLKTLLDKISKLDKQDLQNDGRLYKHFIFSDLQNYNGTKMLCSALIANGMTLGYNSIIKDNKYSSIRLLTDDELLTTRNNNFYLLSSSTVFGQTLNIKTQKQILHNMNRRPENTYGEYVRIIILDSGFKEGIDLFDIKYVHNKSKMSKYFKFNFISCIASTIYILI